MIRTHIMISRLSLFASYLRHLSIPHHFVFILLTAIFLWVPIRFSRPLPITFEPFGICALALLLTARYYLSLDDAERRINLLTYGTLLYGLWVVISAGMHYWAFNSLELEAYLSEPNVTAIRTDKYWAIWTLYHAVKAYLFFPFLFLISIVIFRSTESGWNKLTWIPLIFIPCLLVALYQSYVDANFLNNRPCPNVDCDWLLGGLGTNLVAFRNSLFLIFPLCVFTVIIAQSRWKKVLYVFLAAIILWLARLSYGRAVIIELLLFAAAIPIVGAWVHGFRCDKGRRYLYAGLVWILAMALLTGIIFPKFGSSMSVLFSERVRFSFTHILKGDLIAAFPEKMEYLRQGLRLIKLSPIAGWGPGSFLRNQDKIRLVNGDPSVIADWLPSQYLEWSADLGLLGAGVALFLYVMPLWMILRVRERVRMREERWAAGIIFVTLAIMFLIFTVDSNIILPEGQWILVVYLGFLISVALKYGYTFYPIRGWGWGIGALLLTTVFIAGVYETTFGSRGYRAIYREVLFYPDSQGQSRAGEKATDAIKTSVAAVEASSNIFNIMVSAAARNNRLLEGVRLKIFMNDELLDDRYFFKSLEKIFYYYVPSIKNRKVEIKTEIHQIFKPYRGDDANIEMTVSPASFIKAFPEEGIGFYEWGKSMVGRRFPPGLPSEPVLFDSRWTGMRATFHITDSLREKGVIYASARHPYLNQQPVTVDIIGDKGLIQREWFWNNRWKKIQLMPDQLKQTRTLTFKVNRTWNPRLSAVSDDSRDLGVAVVLPEFEDPYFLFEHLSPSRAEQ